MGDVFLFSFLSTLPHCFPELCPFCENSIETSPVLHVAWRNQVRKKVLMWLTTDEDPKSNSESVGDSYYSY